MLTILLATLLIGLLVLAWSADLLLRQAARLAERLNAPPLLLGVLLVGLGTSAPELLVSAVAAFDGRGDMAAGNAIGSNIANLALVLPLTALLVPLRSASGPPLIASCVLLGITLCVPVLLWDGQLSRGNGAVLLLALVLALFWLARRRSPEVAATATSDAPPWRPLLMALTALALLLLGARVAVWSAAELAHLFGLSELVIGLSVLALGTSLPEIATCLAAARQRQGALLYGNLLGSCLFNLLGVLGLAAVIQPLPLPTVFLTRDYLLMSLVTLGAGALLHRRRGTGLTIALLLLATYIGYQWLILGAH